jgi:outer membrane protein assembly factor BamB
MPNGAGLLLTAGTNRRACAFDERTGRRVWRKKLDDQPLGPPRPFGDAVWIATGPRVPALVKLDGATGRELAKRSVVPLAGPPVSAGGYLVAGGLNGSIFAFRDLPQADLAVDEMSEDAWQTAVGGGIRVAPVPWGDTLVVAGTLADSVIALDAATGKRVWSFDAGGAVYGLTAFGSELVVTTYDGRVSGVLPATGSVAWSWTVGGPLGSPAAAREDLVVVVSTDGDVTAIDRKTGPRWTARLRQAVEARPILTDRSVVVATRSGSVVGLETELGTREWSLDFRGPLTTPPTITTDRIFIADGGGHVRAFAHGGGRGREPAPSADRGAEVHPAPARSDGSDSASVSVISRPAGLGVLVDGVFAGWSPVDSVRVEPGIHHVAVRDSAGRLVAPPRAEEWVRLEAAEHKEVYLSTNSDVFVESLPIGATVSAGPQYLGTTPLTVPRTVETTLRFRHPGYADTLVALDAVPSSRLRVRLLPVGGPALPLPPRHEHVSWYTKDWVRWGAPLLTLAAGAAAVLLREEANDAYDAYLVTGERRARESHLDRAERYDRRSLVAWISAEAFFGVAFYSWIRSDERTERALDLPGPTALRDPAERRVSP